MNHITRAVHILVITLQLLSYIKTSTDLDTIRTKIKNEIQDEVNSSNQSNKILLEQLDNNQSRILLKNLDVNSNQKISRRSRRWSHRKRIAPLFSPWTSWSHCNQMCKQRRERYCKVRRKCGETKHIEERRCSPFIGCKLFNPHYFPNKHKHNEYKPPRTTIFYPSNSEDQFHHDDRDYFIVKHHPAKVHRRRKPIYIEFDDYSDNNSDFDYNNFDDYNIQDRGEYDNLPFSDWDRNDKEQTEIDQTTMSITPVNSQSDTFDETTLMNDLTSTTIAESTLMTDSSTGALDKSIVSNGELDRNYGKIFDQIIEQPENIPKQKVNLPNGYIEVKNHEPPIQQHRKHHRRHKYNRKNLYNDWNEEFSYFNEEPTIEPLIFNNQYFDMSSELYRQGRYMRTDNLTDDLLTDLSINNNNNNNNNYGREKAVFDAPGRKRIFSKWSKWSKCSTRCQTKRFKRCRAKEYCGNQILRETAFCYTEGSFCETWINNAKNPVQQKPMSMLNNNYNYYLNNNNFNNNNNALKPSKRPTTNTIQTRRDTIPNSINFNSKNKFDNQLPITFGRNNRLPEYTPQNIQCGFPAVRNKPKHYLSNMLRIIGGKTARKGQWPWQVAILNRFKEAFCGGTLISPIWVLTAAHCVRKKLYVRLGEHNLEVEDGTEIEFRVESSIKHPKYDKRTVDNDVAMLRLPREVTPSMYIGFACLPFSYQQLPKSHQCTIIGWGKRRNTDDAGTNVLHEAEVPIISNEECMNVYYDYTITKNMFCAGHKRGRIDTCAGDSGGPLLCRSTAIPDQPWTIFGITSFGDGCGKKNKFGIYAKLPNYVDWIWSVINCNGNCNKSAIRFT